MPLPKDPVKAEESRKKLSEAIKKACTNPEVRKKMSDSAKKRSETPEGREKLSAARKGKKNSEETRKKLSEAHKKRYQNPNERQKTSESSKKMWENPDVRKKIGDALKGKTRTIETRKKQSEAGKGKIRSEEHCRNISEGNKKYFQNPENREKTRLATIKYNTDHSWYGSVNYYEGPQYCEKWTAELRERVRAFFGYCCIECGTPQNTRKLAIHHVHYNKKLCCDDTPRTLVPLCASCHSKTNKGDREYWSEHFQAIIDSYYEGKCWFTKKEMMNFKSNVES
jgi:hypothetical protein